MEEGNACPAVISVRFSLVKRQTAADFTLLSCRESICECEPPCLPPNVATRGHGFSRISCGPFCYWNLMIRRPRGAPLHKYLRDKSLRRSTCLFSPPLVLTAVPPFPRPPHPFVLLVADSYTNLSATRQLYELRLNSVGPRVIDSPTMIPPSVRTDEREFSFFF